MTRMAPRARRLSIAAAVALTAVGMSAPPASAELSANPADTVACSDVLLLGARGSGQPQSGSTADGSTGLGPQVYGVYQRLVRQVPGRAIAAQAVVYPAQGVQTLATNTQAYFSSLELGAQGTQSVLRERAAACPRERLVLVGYSQGAMAVHRALQDLDRAGDPVARSILARTDGAILISDGDRRRRDRATDYGTAGRSEGVGYALRPDSGARGTKLPAGMKDRIHSICMGLDVVCDYQPEVHAGVGLLAGARIHSDGYTQSRPVNRATDAVAAQLRRP